ncbi:MAG: hypothetical protein WCH75_24430, partial [Candidatus Binatia bacterium]
MVLLDSNSWDHAIGSALEKLDRHPQHDEEKAEIRERKSPSTTAIDAISKLEISLFVLRAYHQID